MMENKTYDIIVIGSGPGGYVSALRGAQLGAKVLVVEEEELGGVCLNRGCIPTKTLIASISVFQILKDGDSLGLKIDDLNIDLNKIIERKERIVRQLRGGIEFLFKRRGVELMKARATLKDRGLVLAEGDDGSKKELRARKIIIATGSRALELPNLPFDGERIIDSTSALDLRETPQSLLIIGAGAVGVEFASIFNALGSEVTLVEMLPCIIPAEDEELSRELERSFKTQGIKILVSTRIERVEDKGNFLKAITSKGEEIHIKKILIAAGRRLNSYNLGLEDLGIKTERDRILVNEKMETNIPDIYAIGDVVGGALLAHKASKEGTVAAENACGLSSYMDYSAVPSCIYTYPEVASVGIKEKEAEERGIKVKVGRFPFSASGKAQVLGKTRGFVKIMAEAKSKEILGAQIIGYRATELIAELAVAVRNRLTLGQITQTIHAHPTLSEAVMEAAEGIEKGAIHLA